MTPMHYVKPCKYTDLGHKVVVEQKRSACGRINHRLVRWTSHAEDVTCRVCLAALHAPFPRIQV